MKNLKERLMNLQTGDFQNRGGNYPKSGVPTSIECYDNNNHVDVYFSFKNTSIEEAEKWIKNYIQDEFGNDVKFYMDSMQDGDYENDWISTMARFENVDLVIPEAAETTSEAVNDEKVQEVKEAKNAAEPKEMPKVEKEIIYGIKVSKGINQTLIWKVLKKVCENKDEEGIEVANKLNTEYPEVFKSATKCLGSKKRISYIESIVG